MKTTQFHSDFYARLHEAIMASASDAVYDDEHGHQGTYYVDGYEVELTAYFNWERHDESFDHAFGTWHDPFPYMEATSLDDIDEVTVRDDMSGEEVSGFDRDAFMAQFEQPFCLVYRKCESGYRHCKVNSGDKVFCFGKDAVFLAKNNENGKLKIKTDKGTYYVESKYIKFY